MVTGFTKRDVEMIAWAALCRGNTFAWSVAIEQLRAAGGRRASRVLFCPDTPERGPQASRELDALELAEAWAWVRAQFGPRDQVILDHLVNQDPPRSHPCRGASPRGGARRAAAELGITESAVGHRRRKIEQRLPELLRRAGLVDD